MDQSKNHFNKFLLLWSGVLADRYDRRILMVMAGLRENVVLICTAGFLFFLMLPFINTSIDFLIRINIDNELQGRAWGFIGVISQLGYVFAYAISGALADGIGAVFGIGVGRGAGFLIVIAGVFLSVTALILYQIKSVQKLEEVGVL